MVVLWVTSCVNGNYMVLRQLDCYGKMLHAHLLVINKFWWVFYKKNKVPGLLSAVAVIASSR